MPVSRFLRSTTAAPLSLADLKLALRVEGDEFDDMLTRNLAAANERIERTAPGTPTATKGEAAIRFVAFLFEGPDSNEISQAGAWRRCGAAGLLSPWTVRRAGTIG